MATYQSIPLATIATYLKVASSDKLPIISVGCGSGRIEYKLRVLGVQNMILVDPEPESYHHYPKNGECLKTDYPLVSDLIATKPEVVSNCVLFLCWPDPCESTYDIEAIQLLKPSHIILLYETLGGAGGDHLHTWLYKLKAPECTDFSDDETTEKVNLPSLDYKLIRYHNDSGVCDTIPVMVHSLSWISNVPMSNIKLDGIVNIDIVRDYKEKLDEKLIAMTEQDD